LAFLLVVVFLPSGSALGTSFITVEELANRLGMTCQNDVATFRQVLTDGTSEVVICPGLYNALVNDRLVLMESRACTFRGNVMVPESLFGSIRSHIGGRSGRGAIQSMLPVVTGRKKIVIDPGHGGKDPGAIGVGGLKEKQVNLSIALRLRDILRAKGYDVVMTREDDTFIPLDERAAIANREGADLFVSIHANSTKASSANGFETFFVDDRGPYTTTARGIAAARDSMPSVEVLGTKCSLTTSARVILYSALLEEYRLESKEMAEFVQQKLREVLDTQDRGAKGNRGLRVLRYSRCPGVLIEVGFLSNARTAALLRRSSHLNRLAEAIAKAIEKYMDLVSATAGFTR